MKPLRVFYIETGSGYGGSAQSLYQFLKALDRKRFRPIVVTYREGSGIQKIRALGVPVYVVSAQATRSSGYVRLLASWLIHELPRMIRLMRLIVRERVDLVHLNTDLYSTVAGVWAAKLTRRPIICHLRLHRKPTRFEYVFGHLVDWFVVLTQQALALYQSYWPKQRFVVAYDGVEILQDAAPVDRSLPKKFGLGPSAPIVGLIARCVPGKGYEEFIKASAIVYKCRADVRFLIVGNGPGGDPTHEASMRDLGLRLGLDGALIWAGWHNEIGPILSCLDIVVQASTLREGLSRVILEAMAYGKPIVATSLPTSVEALGDGEAGLLVPPGDAKALAEGIITLLENPALAKCLTAQGRRRVEEHFSLQAHARKIQQVYEELLRA